MSYLFSEAKNATASARVADLSLGARFILAWMLLVELLRKKVDEIRMRGSYSGAIQRAGRVAWLGNLVFFNIRAAGRKAVFSILWILCATRVVQRIAFTEIGKRSYAHSKNARLINSYMAQILHHDGHPDQAAQGGQEVLKRCKYIVMGEEKSVQEPVADGYRLNVTTLGDDSSIVTVGKVWELLGENDRRLFACPEQVGRLKRLCLSFALFKLLRRRFEHLPAVTDEEARHCRELILKGLLHNSNDESSAEALFQVMNDEVNFLCEYYHSVVPVVLASPGFLLVNYFFVLTVVAFLCIMTVILCGNGDAIFAFSSIRAENYTLHSGGFGRIAICLVIKARNLPGAFFSILDLSITVLLFVIYFYEEIWEFFVFLLSNWFMVSLVSSYIAKPHWRESASFRFAFQRITWLRSKMSHGNLSFRQFSVLNLRWPLKLPLYSTLSLAVRKELVPRNVKRSIIDYLLEHDRGTANYTLLTNGKSALLRNNPFYQLSWACKSDSVAEVILTWHIATGILELELESKQQQEVTSSRTAIRLSKYCAYLVVFHPELLPDNPEKAERVVDDMKAELSTILGCWGYYLSSQRARVEKIRRVIDGAIETREADGQVEAAAARPWRSDQNGVVRNGAKLGSQLLDVVRNNGAETVWKALADVWTELIVFAAPSSDEERVKGHEEVLVHGGEFVTVIWALTTHTGVSRTGNKPTGCDGPRTLVDLFGESMRAPFPASELDSMM